MRKSIFLLGLLMSACNIYSREFKSPDSTFLSGNAPSLHEGDTVTLYLSRYGDFDIDREVSTNYTTIVQDGKYIFSFSLSKFPAYFSLLFKMDSKLNMAFYLMESGDNIFINRINSDSIGFTGKGANNLKLQYEIRKMHLSGYNRIPGWELPQIKRTFSILDSLAIKEIEHLTKNKRVLGDTLYTLLVADILGESGLRISYSLPYIKPEKMESWRKELADYKNKVWEKYNKFSRFDYILKYSMNYANALIFNYKWDSCVAINRPFDIKDCYNYISKKFKGSLRERTITTLLYENRKKTEDLSYCLKTALRYIEHEDFKRILQNLQTGLTKGSLAFRFALPDTSGIIHTYDELKGKVILLDFWFTGCIGCRLIKPKIDSIANLYKDKEIIFISISIDKNKDQWINSISRGIYTSEHAINLYTEGKGSDHPIILHYLINAYPTLILIDKQGKLCNSPIDPRIDSGKDLVDLINKSLKQ